MLGNWVKLGDIMVGNIFTLTVSAPSQFSAKKKFFFKKFYSYFSFYAREENFK